MISGLLYSVLYRLKVQNKLETLLHELENTMRARWYSKAHFFELLKRTELFAYSEISELYESIKRVFLSYSNYIELLLGLVSLFGDDKDKVWESLQRRGVHSVSGAGVRDGLVGFGNERQNTRVLASKMEFNEYGFDQNHGPHVTGNQNFNSGRGLIHWDSLGISTYREPSSNRDRYGARNDTTQTRNKHDARKNDSVHWQSSNPWPISSYRKNKERSRSNSPYRATPTKHRDHSVPTVRPSSNEEDNPDFLQNRGNSLNRTAFAPCYSAELDGVSPSTLYGQNPTVSATTQQDCFNSKFHEAVGTHSIQNNLTHSGYSFGRQIGNNRDNMFLPTSIDQDYGSLLGSILIEISREVDAESDAIRFVKENSTRSVETRGSPISNPNRSDPRIKKACFLTLFNGTDDVNLANPLQVFYRLLSGLSINPFDLQRQVQLTKVSGVYSPQSADLINRGRDSTHSQDDETGSPIHDCEHISVDSVTQSQYIKRVDFDDNLRRCGMNTLPVPAIDCLWILLCTLSNSSTMYRTIDREFIHGDQKSRSPQNNDVSENTPHAPETGQNENSMGSRLLVTFRVLSEWKESKLPGQLLTTVWKLLDSRFRLADILIHADDLRDSTPLQVCRAIHPSACIVNQSQGVKTLLIKIVDKISPPAQFQRQYDHTNNEARLADPFNNAQYQPYSNSLPRTQTDYTLYGDEHNTRIGLRRNTDIWQENRNPVIDMRGENTDGYKQPYSFNHNTTGAPFYGDTAHQNPAPFSNKPREVSEEIDKNEHPLPNATSSTDNGSYGLFSLFGINDQELDALLKFLNPVSIEEFLKSVECLARDWCVFCLVDGASVMYGYCKMTVLLNGLRYIDRTTRNQLAGGSGRATTREQDDTSEHHKQNVLWVFLLTFFEENGEEADKLVQIHGSGYRGGDVCLSTRRGDTQGPPLSSRSNNPNRQYIVNYLKDCLEESQQLDICSTIEFIRHEAEVDDVTRSSKIPYSISRLAVVAPGICKMFGCHISDLDTYLRNRKLTTVIASTRDLAVSDESFIKDEWYPYPTHSLVDSFLSKINQSLYLTDKTVYFEFSGLTENDFFDVFRKYIDPFDCGIIDTELIEECVDITYRSGSDCDYEYPCLVDEICIDIINDPPIVDSPNLISPKSKARGELDANDVDNLLLVASTYYHHHPDIQQSCTTLFHGLCDHETPTRIPFGSISEISKRICRPSINADILKELQARSVLSGKIHDKRERDVDEIGSPEIRSLVEGALALLNHSGCTDAYSRGGQLSLKLWMGLLLLVSINHWLALSLLVDFMMIDQNVIDNSGHLDPHRGIPYSAVFAVLFDSLRKSLDIYDVVHCFRKSGFHSVNIQNLRALVAVAYMSEYLSELCSFSSVDRNANTLISANSPNSKADRNHIDIENRPSPVNLKVSRTPTTECGVGNVLSNIVFEVLMVVLPTVKQCILSCRLDTIWEGKNCNTDTMLVKLQFLCNQIQSIHSSRTNDLDSNCDGASPSQTNIHTIPVNESLENNPITIGRNGNIHINGGVALSGETRQTVPKLRLPTRVIEGIDRKSDHTPQNRNFNAIHREQNYPMKLQDIFKLTPLLLKTSDEMKEYIDGSGDRDPKRKFQNRKYQNSDLSIEDFNPSLCVIFFYLVFHQFSGTHDLTRKIIDCSTSRESTYSLLGESPQNQGFEFSPNNDAEGIISLSEFYRSIQRCADVPKVLTYQNRISFGSDDYADSGISRVLALTSDDISDIYQYCIHMCRTNGMFAELHEGCSRHLFWTEFNRLISIYHSPQRYLNIRDNALNSGNRQMADSSIRVMRVVYKLTRRELNIGSFLMEHKIISLFGHDFQERVYVVKSRDISNCIELDSCIRGYIYPKGELLYPHSHFQLVGHLIKELRHVLRGCVSSDFKCNDYPSVANTLLSRKSLAIGITRGFTNLFSQCTSIQTENTSLDRTRSHSESFVAGISADIACIASGSISEEDLRIHQYVEPDEIRTKEYFRNMAHPPDHDSTNNHKQRSYMGLGSYRIPRIVLHIQLLRITGISPFLDVTMFNHEDSFSRVSILETKIRIFVTNKTIGRVTNVLSTTLAKEKYYYMPENFDIFETMDGDINKGGCDRMTQETQRKATRTPNTDDTNTFSEQSDDESSGNSTRRQLHKKGNQVVSSVKTTSFNIWKRVMRKNKVFDVFVGLPLRNKDMLSNADLGNPNSNDYRSVLSRKWRRSHEIVVEMVHAVCLAPTSEAELRLPSIHLTEEQSLSNYVDIVVARAKIPFKSGQTDKNIHRVPFISAMERTPMKYWKRFVHGKTGPELTVRFCGYEEPSAMITQFYKGGVHWKYLNLLPCTFWVSDMSHAAIWAMFLLYKEAFPSPSEAVNAIIPSVLDDLDTHRRFLLTWKCVARDFRMNTMQVMDDINAFRLLEIVSNRLRYSPASDALCSFSISGDVTVTYGVPSKENCFIKDRPYSGDPNNYLLDGGVIETVQEEWLRSLLRSQNVGERLRFLSGGKNVKSLSNRPSRAVEQMFALRRHVPHENSKCKSII